MQRFHALQTVRLTTPCALTLGIFDGLHRGHQRLVQATVQSARAEGYPAIVLSFFPHPDLVFGHATLPYYLLHPDEKARLLAQMGVDIWVVQTFDRAFSQLSAEDFLAEVVEHLRPRFIFATADFAFGAGRRGTLDFLRQARAGYGFEVQEVPLMSEDGERLSSTRLRQALQAGDVDEVRRGLGRPYRLSGEIIHGDGRGRGLGFPTANLAVWEAQLRPANGVYACFAYLDGTRHPAVSNIGVRPTFGAATVRVETHLLDFTGDIYGRVLDVDFMARLRGEQKFEGVAALQAQIGRDLVAARSYLAGTIET
jgi:riboflavin kinase/FMN adenylyltransferase